MIFKIHHKKGKRFHFESHINDFLIGREKAQASETFLVVIDPGKTTHLHRHPDVEQVFFVIHGSGNVWTKKKGKRVRYGEIKSGEVVFIPINHWHQVSCAGKIRLEYLCFNAFPNGYLSGENTALAHALKVRMAQKRSE